MRLRRGTRTHLSLLATVSNAAVACDKVLFSKPATPWRGQANRDGWLQQGLEEWKEDKTHFTQQMKNKKYDANTTNGAILKNVLSNLEVDS